jgi:hypothetical protein
VPGAVAHTGWRALEVEMRKVQAELEQAKGSVELSDEELERVAGGDADFNFSPHGDPNDVLIQAQLDRARRG